MIVPVFLTGIGCGKKPCVYCNQYIASSKSFIVNKKEINERIKGALLEYLTNTKIDELNLPIEVAFYGSNFTALSFDEQKEILTYTKEEFERITDKASSEENLIIRFSTRPDEIRRHELLDLYIRFNLRTVEIGVQSMDDKVLKLSGRSYGKEEVIKAARAIKKSHLKLSCHQMIGLPGATLRHEVSTAKQIIKLKPDFVRIHPTLVLKGTKLDKMYQKKEYKPLSIEHAVRKTERVLSIYKENNVKVIRVGLHPSEILLDSIVAGPWHPSFRELVEGRFLYNKVSKLLDKDHKGAIKISISPQDETYLRGEKNKNYNNLVYNHKLKELQIEKNPGLKRGDVDISILN